MQALRLPALRGWYWMVEGYGLFRRHVATIGFMSISCWLLFVILLGLAPVGPLLGVLLVPSVFTGVVSACRNVDRGMPAPFSLLVEGLRKVPGALLRLGLVHMLYVGSTFAVVSLVDGGSLLDVLAGAPLTEAELQESNIAWALRLLFLLMIPWAMVYCFAPVLIIWHRLPVLKALFFSGFACWRNWRAILVYFFSLFVIALLVPWILLGVVMVMVPELLSIMLTMVNLLLLTVLSPVLFASYYVSFRDIFQVTEPVSEYV